MADIFARGQPVFGSSLILNAAIRASVARAINHTEGGTTACLRARYLGNTRISKYSFRVPPYCPTSRKHTLLVSLHPYSSPLSLHGNSLPL